MPLGLLIIFGSRSRYPHERADGSVSASYSVEFPGPQEWSLESLPFATCDWMIRQHCLGVTLLKIGRIPQFLVRAEPVFPTFASRPVDAGGVHPTSYTCVLKIRMEFHLPTDSRLIRRHAPLEEIR